MVTVLNLRFYFFFMGCDPHSSSFELKHCTAIIVALHCSHTPKEIVDFFHFPNLIVYAFAKTLKGPRWCSYNWQNQVSSWSPHSWADLQWKGCHASPFLLAKSRTQQRRSTLMWWRLVKWWMVAGAGAVAVVVVGKLWLYQEDGAPAHTPNLVQNWCGENLEIFW